MTNNHEQRESATMHDDDYCNHESPDCRGPVTLWTRPTDWTRWPYCEYHGDRRDRKETRTRNRYR